MVILALSFSILSVISMGVTQISRLCTRGSTYDTSTYDVNLSFHSFGFSQVHLLCHEVFGGSVAKILGVPSKSVEVYSLTPLGDETTIQVDLLFKASAAEQFNDLSESVLCVSIAYKSFCAVHCVFFQKVEFKKFGINQNHSVKLLRVNWTLKMT